MKKRSVIMLSCCVLAISATTQIARADMIARYECNMVDFATQEPIGDRADHTLSFLHYSCVAVDGLLKGALYTGSNTVEWDGVTGRIIVGGGIHRIPGSRLVTQLTEGAVSIVMKDGKFAGNDASGKGTIKFASGAYAALNGKQMKFASTPISPIRFALELTTE